MFDPLIVDLFRFQYFLSVVPTTYFANEFGGKVIHTNQYAVTEQSHPAAGHLGYLAPGIVTCISKLILGIFFKYDVEPLQLAITHEHISTYRFLMRLVALIGGVAICTEWAYKGYDALVQRGDGTKRASVSDGLLNGQLEKEV
jgi:endoplasmic reticulum-Golgi intermediate compartment protein 2